MELGNLSNTLCRLGRLAAAKEASKEALAIYREFGEVPGIAASLGRPWRAELTTKGTPPPRCRHLKEAMSLSAQVGDRFIIAEMLGDLGNACAGEEPKRAARLWGAAEHAARGDRCDRRSDRACRAYSEVRKLARAAMVDDKAFDAAWRSGRALDFQGGHRLRADDGAAPGLRGVSGAGRHDFSKRSEN